jgi:hypothetical protein
LSRFIAYFAGCRGWGLCTVWLAVGSALSGCDLTGTYDAKFQKALQTANLRAMFDQRLLPNETEITDVGRQNVGVKLRLPTYIDKDSKALPPAEPRAQPPFVQLPHLSLAYERALDDAAGKFLPVYLYVATVPKAEIKADALQAALLQPLAAAFPGAAWADTAVPTPDGQTRTLKRLRAEGPQDFTNLQDNSTLKQDGRFDLYLIDGTGHHVLFGWRSAKGQGEKWMYPASEAAMGTIQIEAGMAPAEGPGAAKGAGG